MGIRTVEWNLNSAYLTYEEIEDLEEILKSLSGDDTINITISDSIGTISVYVNSYDIDYTSHSRGRIVLNCRQYGGGEFFDVALLLPIAGIPTQMNAAYQHLVANARELDNDPNNYSTYSPLVYLFANNFHTKTPVDYDRYLWDYYPYQVGMLYDNICIWRALQMYVLSGMPGTAPGVTT